MKPNERRRNCSSTRRTAPHEPLGEFSRQDNVALTYGLRVKSIDAYPARAGSIDRDTPVERPAELGSLTADNGAVEYAL